MLFRVLVVLLTGLAGQAMCQTWQIDRGTSISVDVPWRGTSVEVRFAPPTGVIEFDPDAPQRTRATLRVDAGSATTGAAPVDALVRSEGYLATDRFQTIDFELLSLVRTSSSTADVAGRLTLRGTTLPVDFKARVLRYGPSEADPSRFEAGFDLAGVIDRRQFGSTGGLPHVAAMLPVRVRLMLSSVN